MVRHHDLSPCVARSQQNRGEAPKQITGRGGAWWGGGMDVYVTVVMAKVTETR